MKIVRPPRETELRTRKGEEKGTRENEREKGKKKVLDRKRKRERNSFTMIPDTS